MNTKVNRSKSGERQRRRDEVSEVSKARMAFNNVDGYLQQLVQEKNNLKDESVHARRLLDQEIAKVQRGEEYVTPVTLNNVHTGKHVHICVKVVVPVREHPTFNFVGKLLGPKGNSLKRLQESTQTKMAVLGRGSMRDKAKEEELRKTNEPKYVHLHEDLHVEIEAYAPPAEAYYRISRALHSLQRFLIPDYYDEIRQAQLRELAVLHGEEPDLDFDPASDPFCDGSYNDQVNSSLRENGYCDTYYLKLDGIYESNEYRNGAQPRTICGKLPPHLPRPLRRGHPYLSALSLNY